MYNKLQFLKSNDKKVLHKIKKQWVAVSLALLMIIGVGSVATYTDVNASNITNQPKQTVMSKASSLHAHILQNNTQHYIKAISATNDSVNGVDNGVSYTIRGEDAPYSIEYKSGTPINNNDSAISVTRTLDNPKYYGLGPSDYQLTSVKVDNNVNTQNATDLTDAFSDANGNGEPDLYLGKNFNTRKAYHSTVTAFNSDSSSDNDTIKTDGTYHMIPEGYSKSDGLTGVSTITITSPDTIFNKDAMNTFSDGLSGSNIDKDAWRNEKTGKIIHLCDGKSHVGTFDYVRGYVDRPKRRNKTKRHLNKYKRNYHIKKSHIKRSRNTGIYNGVHFRFNPKQNILEFTHGRIHHSNFVSKLGSDSANFLTYLPKRFHYARTIKFDNRVDFSKLHNLTSMFDDDHYVRHLILPTNININSINNTSDMFDGDKNLISLHLPKAFNTKNVNSMSMMFANDINLRALVLPKTFNTKNVESIIGMFSNDKKLHKLILPNSFNTRKVVRMESLFKNDKSLHSLNFPKYFSTQKIYKESGSDNDLDSNDFKNVPLTHIHIASKYTKFNNEAHLKGNWRNYYTGKRVKLTNYKSHVGSWINKRSKFHHRLTIRHYHHRR